MFADTGNEHQQTYDYVRYLEQAVGVPIRWVKADFTANIERKREWERLVREASKGGASSFFHASKGTALYGTSNIYNVVEWAKTSRGGKQYDFLRMDGDAPLCSSIYGLCE